MFYSLCIAVRSWRPLRLSNAIITHTQFTYLNPVFLTIQQWQCSPTLKWSGFRQCLCHLHSSTVLLHHSPLKMPYLLTHLLLSLNVIESLCLQFSQRCFELNIRKYTWHYVNPSWVALWRDSALVHKYCVSSALTDLVCNTISTQLSPAPQSSPSPPPPMLQHVASLVPQ